MSITVLVSTPGSSTCVPPNSTFCVFLRCFLTIPPAVELEDFSHAKFAKYPAYHVLLPPLKKHSLHSVIFKGDILVLQLCGLLSLSRFGGCLISVDKHPMGGNKEGAKLASAVPTDRTRSKN